MDHSSPKDYQEWTVSSFQPQDEQPSSPEDLEVFGSKAWKG